jgi:hypothetical protein
MACTSPPALLLLVTSPAEMVEGHVATLTIVRLEQTNMQGTAGALGSGPTTWIHPPKNIELVEASLVFDGL